ncbi:trigger factor-like [Drosophila albomicans]|uniref:Trigger factor-like n=1 Tax=Drosophila albomicans TaxID=7291 RepID=A0A9C6T413_DROAB|nr:trigger factor-like [Drosophila albomicans]
MSDHNLKSSEQPSECEPKKEDNAEETKPILTTLTSLVPPHLDVKDDFDNSDNDESGEPRVKRQKLICWLELCDKPPSWHGINPESDDEEEDSDDEGEEEEEECDDDDDDRGDIQQEELNISIVLSDDSEDED